MSGLHSLLIPLLLLQPSTVVDRVAAIVDQEIITYSDLLWYVADRGQRLPDDENGRREMLRDRLNLLIDQHLIVREAARTPFIQVDETEVSRFIETRRRFDPEDEVNRRLAEAGIDEITLRKTVRRRLMVNKFVGLRIAPFVIVLPQELESFYRHEYVPEFEQNSQTPPPLSVAEESIREILTDRKIAQELEAWLQTARRRARVRILLFEGPKVSSNRPGPAP